MGLDDRGQPRIATGVVDDLQHALPKRAVLDGELGEKTTVVKSVAAAASRISRYSPYARSSDSLVSSSTAEPPGCVPVIAASVEIRCH